MKKKYILKYQVAGQNPCGEGFKWDEEARECVPDIPENETSIFNEKGLSFDKNIGVKNVSFKDNKGSVIPYNDVNTQLINQGFNYDSDGVYRKAEVTENKDKQQYSEFFQALNPLLDLTQLIAGQVTDFQNDKRFRNKLEEARYKKSDYNIYETGFNTAPAYFQYGGIVDFLNKKGMASDKKSRKLLAEKYGVKNYDYSAEKNTELLNILINTVDKSPRQSRKTATKQKPITKEITLPYQTWANNQLEIIKEKSKPPAKKLESGFVVDKTTNTGYILQNGKSVKQFPVLTGQNPIGTDNDFAFSEVAEDPKKRITPVGSFFGLPVDDVYGMPGFYLKSIEAFGQNPKNKHVFAHTTFDEKNRARLYNLPSDNRYVSYGCINCRPGDMKTLTETFPIGDTIMVLDPKINIRDREFMSNIEKGVTTFGLGGDTKDIETYINEYKKGGSVSVQKAKEILRDGTVHGKPLTKKQKGFFGYIAGGGKLARGGSVNQEGYLKDSPYKDNLFNIIPSNFITTEDMEYPIMANGKLLLPDTGKYYIPNEEGMVFEAPIKNKKMLKKAIKKMQVAGDIDDVLTPEQLQEDALGRQITEDISEQFINDVLTNQKPRQKDNYKGYSIVEYLKSKGKTSSYNSRKELAKKLGIENYRGTAEQNLKLIDIIKNDNSVLDDYADAPKIVLKTGATNTTKDANVSGRKNMSKFAERSIQRENQEVGFWQDMYEKSKKQWLKDNPGKKAEDYDKLQKKSTVAPTTVPKGYFNPNSQYDDSYMLNEIKNDPSTPANIRSRKRKEAVEYFGKGLAAYMGLRLLGNLPYSTKYLPYNPSQISQVSNAMQRLLPGFQMGGDVLEQGGVDIDEANGMLEQGEVFLDNSGQIKKVAETEPTHDDPEGGSPQANVDRVLEDTSDKRKDFASIVLKINPKDAEKLTGFKPKRGVTHSKLYEQVIAQDAKELRKIEKRIDKNLEYVKKNGGMYAENSLDENIKLLEMIPTNAERFDQIYEHQEAIKKAYGITNETVEYMKGGKALPKYQVGTTKKYPATWRNYFDKRQKKQYTAPEWINPEQFYATPGLIDYMKTLDVLPGVDNDLKIADDALWGYRHDMALKKFFPNGKPVNTQQPTPTTTTEPVGNSSIVGSTGLMARGMNFNTVPTTPKDDTKYNFNIGDTGGNEEYTAPLGWSGGLGNLLGYVSSFGREPVDFEQLDRNYYRVRDEDITPVINANLSSYNAALEQLPANGVGFANLANLQAQKYKIDTQAISAVENRNKQRQTARDADVEQRKFQLDTTNLGLREQAKNQQLMAKEKQRLQKFEFLNGLFEAIDNRNAFSNNVNLALELTPYFNEKGEFNNKEYMLRPSVKLADGTTAQEVVSKTTGQRKTLITDAKGNIKIIESDINSQRVKPKK